jgi:secreted PhoX family phosphatase
MQNINRRDFIALSSTVGLGFLGLQAFVNKNYLNVNTSKRVGYGELVPDPNKIMDLPKGFSYKIISRQGSKMSDGFFTPGKADGMATFKAKKDRLILVRNHENDVKNLEESPFGENYALLNKIDKTKFYDYGKGQMPSLGGTTTLIFNEKTQTVEQDWLSLVGTNRNCAGGKTPWNSWITCEEDVKKAGEIAEKNHGFNFEVKATTKIKLAEPIPLTAMGRFNHEAVCVDPKTNIIYQTEDAHDGLIYRFIPLDIKNLAKGGKLQALAILGQKSYDTRNWKSLESPKMPTKQTFKTQWIDMEEVMSPDDTLRYQGFDKGAARFARGEGAWFGKNEFYFACTNGGDMKKGQIFRYQPSPFEGTIREKESPGLLELFVEPNNTDLVKYCDNLTIAPWGDLILCEDDDDPYLVGITPQGEFYKLGHNVGYKSELAGVTFSPSGQTLFVNIQHAGLTLAITGAWIKKS